MPRSSPGFYRRNYIGGAVYRTAYIEPQILCIYPFCNLAEYATRHQTARCRKSGLLDGNNATVFGASAGSIRRTDENNSPVPPYNRRHPCEICAVPVLPATANCLLPAGFAKPSGNYFPQNLPYLCQRLVRTDLGIDIFRRKFMDNLTVFTAAFTNLGRTIVPLLAMAL